MRHALLGPAGAVGVLSVAGAQPLAWAVALLLLLAAAASAFLLARQWQSMSRSIEHRLRTQAEADGLARWRARRSVEWSEQVEIARMRLENQVTVLTMNFARLTTAGAPAGSAGGGAAPSVRAAMKLRGELMRELSRFIEEIRKTSQEAIWMAEQAQALNAFIEAERASHRGQHSPSAPESVESTDITVF
ncbi:MAG TPA: hypothetical protein VLJ57_09515 [Burkholderiaceae bacterium]|nr:hypothetical protein [Burkholderiaceae bacterium]